MLAQHIFQVKSHDIWGLFGAPRYFRGATSAVIWSRPHANVDDVSLSHGRQHCASAQAEFGHCRNHAGVLLRASFEQDALQLAVQQVSGSLVLACVALEHRVCLRAFALRNASLERNVSER